MSAGFDFARVLEELSTSRLTPYVAYVSHDSVNGMGNSASTSRIVVRVSDARPQ